MSLIFLDALSFCRLRVIQSVAHLVNTLFQSAEQFDPGPARTRNQHPISARNRRWGTSWCCCQWSIQWPWTSQLVVCYSTRLSPPATTAIWRNRMEISPSRALKLKICQPWMKVSACINWKWTGSYQVEVFYARVSKAQEVPAINGDSPDQGFPSTTVKDAALVQPHRRSRFPLHECRRSILRLVDREIQHSSVEFINTFYLGSGRESAQIVEFITAQNWCNVRQLYVGWTFRLRVRKWDALQSGGEGCLPWRRHHSNAYSKTFDIMLHVQRLSPFSELTPGRIVKSRRRNNHDCPCRSTAWSS